MRISSSRKKNHRSNCSLRNRNLIGCIIEKKSIRLRNYSKLVDTGLKSYPSKAAQKLTVTLTLAIFKLLAREWILRWNEGIFSAPAKRWVLARENWDNIYQISCFAIQEATADIVSSKPSSFLHAHKYKQRWIMCYLKSNRASGFRLRFFSSLPVSIYNAGKEPSETISQPTMIGYFLNIGFSGSSLFQLCISVVWFSSHIKSCFTSLLLRCAGRIVELKLLFIWIYV